MKTVPQPTDPRDFIASVTHEGRRADALVLLDLFTRVTGWEPVMWGPSIIGYGRYAYTYDSGHSGEMCATGFSPRAANMVVYILPGYGDLSGPLSRLGPHRIGKSCLYLGRLPGVSLPVLEEIIRLGLSDLAARYPVSPR